MLLKRNKIKFLSVVVLFLSMGSVSINASQPSSSQLVTVKKHQCTKPGCGFSSNYKGHLNRHIRIHTGEKPFKCETCNKEFTRKGDLKVHERTHTGEKSFKCERCGKGFASKGTLTRHMRIHTGEKSFKCETCNKEFARKDTLSAHMRLHTGEKPFKCERCSCAFGDRSSLYGHKNRKNPCKPPYSPSLILNPECLAALAMRPQSSLAGGQQVAPLPLPRRMFQPALATVGFSGGGNIQQSFTGDKPSFIYDPQFLAALAALHPSPDKPQFVYNPQYFATLAALHPSFLTGGQQAAPFPLPRRRLQPVLTETVDFFSGVQ